MRMLVIFNRLIVGRIEIILTGGRRVCEICFRYRDFLNPRSLGDAEGLLFLGVSEVLSKVIVKQSFLAEFLEIVEFYLFVFPRSKQ